MKASNLFAWSLAAVAATAVLLNASRPATAQEPGQGEPIEAGDTAEGTLEEGDLRLPSDDSFYDPYVLQVEAGMRYTITLESDDFDCYLLVIDEQGEVIAQNDDANGLNSQLMLDPEEDGEVTILANSYQAGETGDYTLRVEAGEAGEPTPPRAIAVGEQVSGELDQDDQRLPDNTFYEVWTFQADQGTTYRINMNAAFDTYLILQDSRGNTIAENDDFNGLNSQVDFTAPEAGEYRILANSFGAGATGEYQLSVQDAGAAAAQAYDLENAQPIASGDSVTAELAATRPQLPDRQSYYDVYALDVVGGDQYTVTMTSQFDTYLIVLNDSGGEIGRNDDAPGLGLNSQVQFMVNEDSTVYLLASTFAQNTTGEYTIQVEGPAAGGDEGNGDGSGIDIEELRRLEERLQTLEEASEALLDEIARLRRALRQLQEQREGSEQ